VTKTISKYLYLPAISNDFALCNVGEEFGFIGTVLVLFVFYIMINRMIIISSGASSNFEKYLATGLTMWFFLHGTVNFSSASALIPVSGLGFPFLGMGGTFLVSCLIASGLMLNVSRQQIICKSGTNILSRQIYKSASLISDIFGYIEKHPLYRFIAAIAMLLAFILSWLQLLQYLK
jgi:cell division protein FtsW (lipid II flippase)